MTNYLNFVGEGEVLEYREITVTSKRQITIPKSFFDRLAVEQRFVAYLTNEGIFLKPIRTESETVYDDDLKNIVRKVVSEGYSGEEMVEEIVYRFGEYNKLIEKRIQEFERDLTSDSVSDDESEDEHFYGLDALFDAETGETP